MWWASSTTSASDPDTVPPVTDEDLIELALAEAAAAPAHGDVPVGAVVAVDGQVIASRHNERERLGDPTAHAEMLALRDAATAIGDVAARAVRPWSSPSNRARCAPERPSPPGSHGSCSAPTTRSREPADRSTTWAPIPASTTSTRWSAACVAPSARRCWPSSSPSCATARRIADRHRPRAAVHVTGGEVARADEWGGLESRCGASHHRGFESHTLRCVMPRDIGKDRTCVGFGRLSFRAGLVVAGGVEGEVAEEFSGGLVDDAVAEVVDEEDDFARFGVHRDTRTARRRGRRTGSDALSDPTDRRFAPGRAPWEFSEPELRSVPIR